ncbi:MAG: response regulator [SAR324 cluster bacterium]|nr:response regulator [SAR324 cluster bacterium]
MTNVATEFNSGYWQNIVGSQLMRVLVVDDEQIIRNMLSAYLTKQGYEVQTAENGEEGTTIFYQDPNLFNLIITDIQMPKMNGIEFLTKIRGDGYNTPAVVVTGHLHLAQSEEIYALQVLQLVNKPFKLSLIKTLIDKLPH